MPPLGWRKAVDGGVKGTKGKQTAEHSNSPTTTSSPAPVPERSGVAIEALGGTLGMQPRGRPWPINKALEKNTAMEVDEPSADSTPAPGSSAMPHGSSSENTSNAGMTPPIRSIKLKLKVKAAITSSPEPSPLPVPGPHFKGLGRGTVPGPHFKGRGRGVVPGPHFKGKGRGAAPAPVSRGRGRGRARGGRGRGRGRARKIVEASPSASEEEESPVEEPAPLELESEDDASDGGSEPEAPEAMVLATPDNELDEDQPDADVELAPDVSDIDEDVDAEGEVDEEEEMELGDDVDMSAVSKRLTARQAALVAGGSNMDHVMLPEAPSRKAQRTEAEMALRRSETARKRKHQDAQRLEDEKTETINRLLKKQSAKTRNKKLLEASVDEAGLPVDNSTGAVPENRTTIPCYRWVSSSKETSVALSFSLPSVANGLQTDGETTSFVASQPPVVRPTATCAVSGCTLERKYRLAGAADFEKGACGMDHLKLLKTQAV